MDRLRCSRCGEEHDLSGMEPTFDYPDAYLAVPEHERAERAYVGEDDCRIRDADRGRRYFLRMLLPVPVRGESDDCCWGVWVEVNEDAFARATELWSDPAQSREPPFPGLLGNSLEEYPETLGLPGVVQLTGPSTRPRFTLAPELDHPLAAEQRDGVYPERVLEWLARRMH